MAESYETNGYREFQFGWLIFVFLIPVQILTLYLFLNKIGDSPLDPTTFTIVNVTLVLPYLLFYGMKTKVSQEAITVSFGVGLIKKKILRNRITTVKEVINPWYYGWGIRLIPNGWLYNISGSKGVELTFNDTNRIFRIGTKDSARLKNEIDKFL